MARAITVILALVLLSRLGVECGTSRKSTPSKVAPAQYKSPIRILPSNHPLYKKWRNRIDSAVISPDCKTIALYDGSAVFLTNSQGKIIRKLHITLYENLANEQVSVQFAFRPDSKRVAVFTALIYGEPMGATIERLWTADVRTGSVRRLREWGYRIQGPGPQTGSPELKGWTNGGKAILLTGTIYNGEEMPIDMRKIGNERIVITDMAKLRPKHKK